jgi:photosystem II stability/assembly factor-like uncharacterized protein
LALSVTSSIGLANGRFPRAERLFENPADPSELTLAATYGILTTKDRGQSWYQICEASFSLMDSYLGDPLLDFTGDRTMLVGVQASLNLSHGDACEWKSVLGGGSVFVVDYSISKSQPSTVVAVLADYEGGGISYSLSESTDDGSTWQAIGSKLPAQTVHTLDLDPLDPTHIYVSAIKDDLGQLLSSSDNGSTWTSYAIPNTDVSSAPYIAAVHPTDPEKIFVRTDSWIPIDGDLTANDALLYSSDGGATWTELIRNRAKLFGFALSPDASTVLVGYGDPQGGGGEVVSGTLGVFESAVDSFSFQRTFTGHVGCLTWTTNGLYVCTSQFFDGFELAFSATGDLSSASPVLRLDAIRGPLPCGASTPGFACKSNWEQACLVFGACADDGGKADSAQASSGPTNGMTATAVSTSDAGAASLVPGLRPDDHASGAACACRSTSDAVPTGPGAWLLLSLTALSAVVRRARTLRAHHRNRRLPRNSPGSTGPPACL